MFDTEILLLLRRDKAISYYTYSLCLANYVPTCPPNIKYVNTPQQLRADTVHVEELRRRPSVVYVYQQWLAYLIALVRLLSQCR